MLTRLSPASLFGKTEVSHFLTLSLILKSIEHGWRTRGTSNARVHPAQVILALYGDDADRRCTVSESLNHVEH